MTVETSPAPAGRRSRTRSGGPTVADVAALAGVSPMTVSRVINGERNVQEATRARVDAAIAELDYVPNPAARSLAGGRPCRIALLHSNPSAAYLSDFLVGSLDGASEADAQIVVEAYGPADTPQALLARLKAHRIDGVLLPPPLCDDAGLLGAMAAARVPLAQVASGSPVDGSTSVAIDDAAAAATMTAHLLGLGHRRIGFICGNANQSASAQRRKGHEAALVAAGVAIDPALIVAGDFTYRSGLLAGEALLARDPRPTAIFASNDDMAAAVLAAAHRNRLDVPGDLTVVGFDDSAMARTVWPELTTIRQPVIEMARSGTIELAARIKSKGPPAEVPPPIAHAFELVIRGSDGPPAHAR